MLALVFTLYQRISLSSVKENKTAPELYTPSDRVYQYATETDRSQIFFDLNVFKKQVEYPCIRYTRPYRRYLFGLVPLRISHFKVCLDMLKLLGMNAINETEKMERQKELDTYHAVLVIKADAIQGNVGALVDVHQTVKYRTPHNLNEGAALINDLSRYKEQIELFDLQTKSAAKITLDLLVSLYYDIREKYENCLSNYVDHYFSDTTNEELEDIRICINSVIVESRKKSRPRR